MLEGLIDAWSDIDPMWSYVFENLREHIILDAYNFANDYYNPNPNGTKTKKTKKSALNENEDFIELKEFRIFLK